MKRRLIKLISIIAILFIGAASLLLLYRSNQYIQAGTYINSKRLYNENGSKLFTLTGWGPAEEGDFYFFSHEPARIYQQGVYRRLEEHFLVLLTDDMKCCGYVVLQRRNTITVLWSDGTHDKLYKYDRYAVLP